MKIALDAMGHDDGPAPLVAGAMMALKEFPRITRLILTGDQAQLEALLKAEGCTDPRVEIVHTTQVVEMHDSGLDAVRKKKDSSVSRAVDLVKSGAAEAVVSAGNTGAAVTACTIKLRTLPGIDRPAIASMMPTEHGSHFILCDAGANPDPSAQHLEDNALMAVAYCECVLKRQHPTVGLLSNGTEEYKGNALTLAAHALLKASGLHFHGNVEGHDLFEGRVDVVVTDGFTGNVVLKTSEALAKSIFRLLKRQLLSSLVRKIGAMLCKPGFRAVHAATNADEYGGMPLLGVNGICIIAHGGSSPVAVKNAIRAACTSIQVQLIPTSSHPSAKAMNENRPRPLLQKLRRTVSIIGTGSYVPERILTNAELEKTVETSDEWIVTRTGIRERRIAAEGQATSDLATEAARRAIEMAGISVDEIDLILVATVTPDMAFPSTACFVQAKLGAKNAACFDVSAACSGFLYAIEIAQQFITSHTYDTILVIGAEKLSSIVDWTDRNTCVLFGDGAGAAILRHRGGTHGVLSTYMASDGNLSDILYIPGGGSKNPTTAANCDQRLNTIKMNGKETYKQAVTSMLDAAQRALAEVNLRAEDLACIIPHQANLRIIEAIASRMELPIERFMVNLDRFGNTSAAAVAMALDEANRTGRMKEGDYILLVVFGGGLTWASSVIQW